MTKKKADLVVVREFDAPKEVVFEAFSSAEAMAAWWGPAEFPTVVVKFEFRPKGIMHYKMVTPGEVWWGKFVYVQIQKPDLLEFINSFSDENEAVTRAPFAPLWPLEIFNSIRFTEKNGKTTITLTGYPVNPTDEEYDTFISMQPNVQKGFSGTLDQLDKYLKARK